MKVSAPTLQSFLLASVSIAPLVNSFVVPTPFSVGNQKTTCFMANNGEFDYLLNEGSGSLKFQQEKQQQDFGRISRRNIVCLPDSSDAATLVSSTAAPIEELSLGGAASSADPYGDDDSFEESTFGEEGITDGPPGPRRSDPRMEEYLRKKEAAAVKVQPSDSKGLTQKFGNFVKGKDFGELVLTVFIPLTAGYYLINKGYEKASDNMAGNADQTLEDYANEMVFHDGDFEEMKMCHDDYSKKKLVWLGPKKKDAMIKRYLEVYAKKKTVSPQAISSLSYVLSLYKFSEEKAADTLVELCTSMPEKIASTGKLLFYGNHILKSKEARARLNPIKDMLADSYRDDVGVSGEEIVERSQIAMGEAAYRAAVAAGGKKQTKLTVGWEVLGLDKEKATEIFEEVAHDGFKSSREQKYGTANQKYDKKGRKIDNDGKLDNPDEATDDDDEDDEDTPTGNVQECSECGFTLFIAEGRDFKFFSDSFECPECGAKKDKFVGRS